MPSVTAPPQSPAPPVAPIPAPAPPRARTSPFRLIATTAAHTVVDFFSFIIIPLMTVFKGKVGLSDADAAGLITVGAITSGLIQPLVAWLSDRYDTRLLGTLGVLVAVLAVGLVGYAESHATLLLLTILSAGGIGAFHPVAAAAVGQLSGPHRSFGLSVFYCAGMIGGVAGNVLSPLYVKAAGHGVAVDGLPALAWLIAPGLVCVAMLAWAIHAVAHRHDDAHATHAALPAAERRRRWRAVGQLYASNVIRFGVDSAIIALVIRWTELMALAKLNTPVLTDAARTAAAQMNGPLQAAKQIGMGAGSLAIGWAIRRGGAREHRAMIVVPLFGALAIPLVPHTSPGLGFFIMVVAGLGYGSMVAPSIAMAQRLLPHRTGLASGLMMGGAWAVGSALAPAANSAVDAFGLNAAFLGVGALCLVSSLLAAALPKNAV
jgi:FSR family fosmidomycin resistance protein-like MFS transporter